MRRLFPLLGALALALSLLAAARPARAASLTWPPGKVTEIHIFSLAYDTQGGIAEAKETESYLTQLFMGADVFLNDQNQGWMGHLNGTTLAAFLSALQVSNDDHSFAIWDLISQDPTTKELTAFHADLNRQSGSAPTAIMQAHLLHASPDGHGDSSDLTLTVQFGSSAPASAP